MNVYSNNISSLEIKCVHYFKDISKSYVFLRQIYFFADPSQASNPNVNP